MAESITSILQALSDPGAQRRTLQLANGKTYNVIVKEVASRSSFFEAMFREGSQFAEASPGNLVIELNLPDNEAFDPIYEHLMTGRLPEELTSGTKFLSFVRNADYLQAKELQKHLKAGFKRNMVPIVKASAGTLSNFPDEYIEMLGGNLAGEIEALKETMRKCHRYLCDAPSARYQYQFESKSEKANRITCKNDAPWNQRDDITDWERELLRNVTRALYGLLVAFE